MDSINKFVMIHFPGESIYQNEINPKLSDDNS